MGKRRSNGEGTAPRRRADGLWQVDVSIPGGQRRSFYGKTRQEAVDKANQVKAQIQYGEYIAPTKMTTGEWLDTWFANYLQVSEQTRARYEIDIRKRLKPAFGKIPLAKLTKPMVQSWINKLYTDSGLSDSSVKKAHGVLSAALNCAVDYNMLKRNPAAGIKFKNNPPPMVRPLEKKQINEFLAEAKGTVNEDYFYILLFTGMRQAEAIGLTWENVDFAHGMIHINQQWRKGRLSKQYEFAPPKYGSCRSIKAAAQVMDRLQAIRDKQDQWKEKCGSAWVAKHDFVFTRPDGEFLKASTVYDNFERIVNRMSASYLRVHDLRHTFATLAIYQGMDPKTLAAILGHKDTQMTMERYAHVWTAMRDRSAELIEGFIDKL